MIKTKERKIINFLEKISSEYLTFIASIFAKNKDSLKYHTENHNDTKAVKATILLDYSHKTFTQNITIKKLKESLIKDPRSIKNYTIIDNIALLRKLTIFSLTQANNMEDAYPGITAEVVNLIPLKILADDKKFPRALHNAKLIDTLKLLTKQDNALKLIQKNGLNIRLLGAKFKQDLDLATIAVRQNGFAYLYLDQKTKQKPIIIESALCKNGEIYREIPTKFKTYNYMVMALKSKGNALAYMTEDLRKLSLIEKKSLFKIAIEQNGQSLRYIAEEQKSAELCALAIKQDPTAILYVPKKHINEDSYSELVAKYGTLLNFTPDELKTPKLCSMAVENDPIALKYVPNQFINLQLITTALKQIDAKGNFELLSKIDFTELKKIAEENTTLTEGKTTKPNLAIRTSIIKELIASGRKDKEKKFSKKAKNKEKADITI